MASFRQQDTKKDRAFQHGDSQRAKHDWQWCHMRNVARIVAVECVQCHTVFEPDYRSTISECELCPGCILDDYLMGECIECREYSVLEPVYHDEAFGTRIKTCREPGHRCAECNDSLRVRMKDAAYLKLHTNGWDD